MDNEFKDKYVDTTDAPAQNGGTVNLQDVTSTTSYKGDVTLNGATITGGNRVRLYVNGSVYITSNILYGYSSVETIPLVTIVARDGIYISSAVTELHGTFISQGESGGSFATCTSNIKSETTDFDTCDNKLDIYGSVSAKTLHLNRVSGNYGDTASDSAEEFHYTPESWLPLVTGPTCKKNCKYTHISALPPVL